MILKLLVDVAIALKHGNRCSPVLGCWVGRKHVCGSLTAWEEPHFNESTVPLCGEDSAPDVVEPFTIRHCSRVGDGTALVGRLAGGVDIAVLGDQGSGAASAGDGTARGGVESHGVRCSVIDALDDVDFSGLRPLGGGAERPECWPGAAAGWHVCYVEDYEAALEGLFRFETDTGTTRVRVGVGSVNADVHAGGVGAN